MNHNYPVKFLFFLFLFAFTVWILWANTAPEITSYCVQSPDLPEAFSGFRIAHISDLHNQELGKNNQKLLKLLQTSSPDIIAITGDLIDSRRTDVETALKFVEEAAKIAPCYYVTGNHESRTSDYDSLKDGLLALGVTVLENQSISVTHNGASITLLGAHDPTFHPDYIQIGTAAVMEQTLNSFDLPKDGFTVLLSHRPELLDIYASQSISLTLSGHAHGGQFRLPFIGGLFAPHQGFFPKYTSGHHIQGTSSLIISRGLGNSSFPLRFNNRPELVLIELKSSPA